MFLNILLLIIYDLAHHKVLLGFESHFIFNFVLKRHILLNAVVKDSTSRLLSYCWVPFALDKYPLHLLGTVLSLVPEPFPSALKTSSLSSKWSTNTLKLSLSCSVARLTILPFSTVYHVWQRQAHVSPSPGNVPKVSIQTSCQASHKTSQSESSILPSSHRFCLEPEKFMQCMQTHHIHKQMAPVALPLFLLLTDYCTLCDIFLMVIDLLDPSLVICSNTNFHLQPSTVFAPCPRRHVHFILTLCLEKERPWAASISF